MFEAILVPYVRRSALAALSAMMILAPSCLSQTPREQTMQSREHLSKGNYLLGRLQFPEAIQEYETALQLDPGNTAAKDNIVLTHNNWGISFFKQKKYDDAKLEWNKALELDPYNRMAKNNIGVLNATLARAGQGPGGPATDPKAKASGDKKDKSEGSAVMVLTPGLRQSKVPAASDSAATPSTSNTSPNPAASTYDSVPADNGTPFDSPPTSSPGSNSPANFNAPASSGGGSGGGGGSLEDLLSAIEMKIYGQTQAGMPVIKRLERIETDSTGQVHSGTIKERIDSLRKSYNL